MVYDLHGSRTHDPLAIVFLRKIGRNGSYWAAAFGGGDQSCSTRKKENQNCFFCALVSKAQGVYSKT